METKPTETREGEEIENAILEVNSLKEDKEKLIVMLAKKREEVETLQTFCSSLAQKLNQLRDTLIHEKGSKETGKLFVLFFKRLSLWNYLILVQVVDKLNEEELRDKVYSLHRENREWELLFQTVYNVDMEFDEKRAMPSAVSILSDRYHLSFSSIDHLLQD